MSNQTTILMIDDSRTNKLLVQAYLVGDEYKFVEAADGVEGLSAVRRERPHLVLCDVFMPKMGGWELVEAIRREPDEAIRSVPVILASSKKDKEVARKSMLAGADIFLQKPLAGPKLIASIRKLLGGTASSNPSRRG